MDVKSLKKQRLLRVSPVACWQVNLPTAVVVVVVYTSPRQRSTIIGARVCGGRQSGGKDSKRLNNGKKMKNEKVGRKILSRALEGDFAPGPGVI